MLWVGSAGVLTKVYTAIVFSSGLNVSTVVIIPGSNWTPAARQANRSFQTWWQSHQSQTPSLWIPPDRIAGWDTTQIHAYVQRHLDPAQSIRILAFSAGCVGAAGLVPFWRVDQLIAVDGWGVPLWLPCPVVRLSHDWVTHNNGLLLGGGQEQFYADPFVPHEYLWGSLDQVRGWQVEDPCRAWASQFLVRILGTAGG